MITLQQILKERGIFLISGEHSPLLLPDLSKALSILQKHVQQNNSIGVLGDFDTDGITSTSSFILGFRDLFPQIKTFYKVPERNEGHGINKNNIDYMNSVGVKLIFTCDNGSNDIEQILYANSLGIDVVVTDHHQITVKNYNYCLINCERKDSTYPFSHLCGCGIVYKFLQAIELSDITKHKLQEKTKKTLQRLVTIATIVDMVHLSDENLYFIMTFRNLFNETSDNSFFKLLVELTNYTSDNGKWFGWSVGPLFNSAGRLERANGLIKAIIEENKIQNLKEVLQYYINLNNYRKDLTKEWSLYLKDKVIKTKHVNIIRDQTIPSGLKRLIANEYLEGKIALCGSPNPEDPNIIDCSVSNSYGVNLLDFLSQQEYTASIGGHYGAFGFSYYLEKEEEFLSSLNSYIDTLDISQHVFSHDYELTSSNINLNFAKDISSFIWGTGLKEPIFKITGVCESVKILAKKHMKLSVRLSDGRVFDVIKWGETNYKRYLLKQMNYNVTININRYKGNETIQFFLQ